jgi:serine/threonine-protein phosphatase 2A regulatory subunit B'
LAGAGGAGAGGALPRADVGLPSNSARRERRRSSLLLPGGGGLLGASASAAEASLAREQMLSTIVELPAFRDVPPARREPLFKQKLALCSVVGLKWDDPAADARPKELKRLALAELVDFVSTPAGQKIFTEATYADVIAMVTANISRAFPPASSGPAGGEEDAGGGVAGSGEGEDVELFLEPSWPHLQLVYEFLLRFVVSNEVKIKTAKKVVDQAFCTRLVELFDSEDPRERDYLKTILHRIYGKFLSHRSAIRRAISNVFFRFVYETEHHNGIGELLEILGSIINGFALPLKEEHVAFLERALLPLHRPRCIAKYVSQLSFCMVQYIEKDPGTVCNIVRGIVRTWPWSSSQKQIVLLGELEELFELAGADAALPVLRDLFVLLARCCGSSHFQVAERALALWNNEQLVTPPGGVLSATHAAVAVPLLFDALQRQSAGHWNPNVDALACRVVQHYCDADAALFARVAAGSAAAAERAAQVRAVREGRWEALERQVAEARAARGSEAASDAKDDSHG